ncbi:GTP-binding protein [Thiomicrorhabdus xiamenensis]|uniref:GTP-binding protein n=1 Tax=Thiomicrorhabdus xiamenensis TaxID=2739063 RepID=A0A7D4NJX6_9GAMM|nr:GTP-binding protein [Thiomicrorhabdus xiamenensis]QKI88709.1 GTP-binding protein [Thiomicrorhabdus xiamenensis]
MQARVLLYGLPGSGKHRLAEQWRKSSGQAIDVLDVQALDKVYCEESRHKCLVIDSRSFWQMPRDLWLEEILQQLITAADSIVLNFLEASELSVQMAWKNWLRDNAADTPVLMSLQQAVPQGLSALLERTPQKRPLPQNRFADLQSFEFRLNRVSLEHLLMVLDNAKTALGMKLIRVQGVLETLEYDNRVALEGAAYRWDTFAADEREIALRDKQLRLQGFDLDKAWLQQMLQACNQ